MGHACSSPNEEEKSNGIEMNGKAKSGQGSSSALNGTASNSNQLAPCLGCSVPIDKANDQNRTTCPRCGSSISSRTNSSIDDLLPFETIQFAVFYESLPSDLRVKPPRQNSSNKLKPSSPSPSNSLLGPSSINSAASSSPVPPPLPHINLTKDQVNTLMATYILPYFQSQPQLRLQVGQLISIPLSHSPRPRPSHFTFSVSSPSPSSNNASRTKAPVALKLKVTKAYPPIGFIQLEKKVVPTASATVPSSVQVNEEKVDEVVAAAAASSTTSPSSFPPTVTPPSTAITLQPTVFSLTRQLRSVTILPLESSAQSRPVPLSPATDQGEILKTFLKPHFQTYIKHRHLYEGYVFVSEGVQFKVATCQPMDGCLGRDTDIFAYFHPLKELERVELVPVASSFPIDPDTQLPMLPANADVALRDFIVPYFHANNFMAFTRESIIAIPHPPPHPVATKTSKETTPLIESIATVATSAGDTTSASTQPDPISDSKSLPSSASSSSSCSTSSTSTVPSTPIIPSSPTLWKIVSLSPEAGGLVTGATVFTCSNLTTGMTRSEYLKRQDAEDAEYALLVQKQQTIQCVDEEGEGKGGESAEEEWNTQQRTAVQLKERLGAALTRIPQEQRHEIWLQLYEQLDQLSSLRPGSVPIRHFTTLLTNVQTSLGAHSNLLSGATSAEIDSLPVRAFRPAESRNSQVPESSVISRSGLPSASSRARPSKMAASKTRVTQAAASPAATNSSSSSSATAATATTPNGDKPSPKPPKKRSAPKKKQDSTVDENKACMICLCEYERGEMLRSLPCFHAYHRACIDPWLKNNRTCPQCRTELS